MEQLEINQSLMGLVVVGYACGWLVSIVHSGCVWLFECLFGFAEDDTE